MNKKKLSLLIACLAFGANNVKAMQLTNKIIHSVPELFEYVSSNDSEENVSLKNSMIEMLRDIFIEIISNKSTLYNNIQEFSSNLKRDIIAYKSHQILIEIKDVNSSQILFQLNKEFDIFMGYIGLLQQKEPIFRLITSVHEEAKTNVQKSKILYEALCSFIGNINTNIKGFSEKNGEEHTRATISSPFFYTKYCDSLIKALGDEFKTIFSSNLERYNRENEINFIDPFKAQERELARMRQQVQQLQKKRNHPRPDAEIDEIDNIDEVDNNFSELSIRDPNFESWSGPSLTESPILPIRGNDLRNPLKKIKKDPPYKGLHLPPHNPNQQRINLSGQVLGNFMELDRYQISPTSSNQSQIPENYTVIRMSSVKHPDQIFVAKKDNFLTMSELNDFILSLSKLGNNSNKDLLDYFYNTVVSSIQNENIKIINSVDEKEKSAIDLIFLRTIKLFKRDSQIYFPAEFASELKEFAGIKECNFISKKVLKGKKPSEVTHFCEISSDFGLELFKKMILEDASRNQEDDAYLKCLNLLNIGSYLASYKGIPPTLVKSFSNNFSSIIIKSYEQRKNILSKNQANYMQGSDYLDLTVKCLATCFLNFFILREPLLDDEKYFYKTIAMIDKHNLIIENIEDFYNERIKYKLANDLSLTSAERKVAVGQRDENKKKKTAQLIQEYMAENKTQKDKDARIAEIKTQKNEEKRTKALKREIEFEKEQRIKAERYANEIEENFEKFKDTSRMIQQLREEREEQERNEGFVNKVSRNIGEIGNAIEEKIIKSCNIY